MKIFNQLLEQYEADFICCNTAVIDHTIANSLNSTNTNSSLPLIDIEHSLIDITPLTMDTILEGGAEGYECLIVSHKHYKRLLREKNKRKSRRDNNRKTLKLPEEVFIVKSKDTIKNRRFGSINPKTKLETALSNPTSNASLKLDRLELMIDATREEVNSLISLIESECYSFVIGKVAKGKDSRHIRSLVMSSKNSHIELQYHARYRGENSKHKARDLKLVINPSKYNSRHLSVLVSKFKLAWDDKYIRLIRNAKISRYDIALDIKGLHVMDVYFNRQKCAYRTTYLCTDGSWESVIEGADHTTRFTAYDKKEEMICEALEYGDEELADKLREGEEFTRLEISFRCNKNKEQRGIVLSAFKYFDSPFALVNFYNIDLLFDTELPDDQMKYLKVHGLNKLLRKLVQKDKIALKRKIKHSQIRVNHEQLLEMQTQSFSTFVKKLLPKHHSKLKRSKLLSLN